MVCKRFPPYREKGKVRSVSFQRNILIQLIQYEKMNDLLEKRQKNSLLLCFTMLYKTKTRLELFSLLHLLNV